MDVLTKLIEHECNIPNLLVFIDNTNCKIYCIVRGEVLCFIIFSVFIERPLIQLKCVSFISSFVYT